MAVMDRLTYLIETLNAHHDPVLLLHRVQKAELLEKGVVVPDGFDLDAYVSKEYRFHWARISV